MMMRREIKNPFEYLACAVLAAALVSSAAAQTRPGTAPTRPLMNPFGSTAAIGGQSRPLGGIPAYGYRNGTFRRERGRFGYGAGIWGYSTYIPGYWDLLGDPVGPYVTGPYSYTWPYYGMAAPPPIAALPAPSSAAPAPVIINQYFGYPPAGSGNGPEPVEAPAHAGDPLTSPDNYYLIAYKDHSIHAALAYWVEGNTLHYVTTDNAHNQVSLDLVDIPASTKLNSDHNVPFSIAGR